MCVSVNRPSIINQPINNGNNVSNPKPSQPLNLDLPPDFKPHSSTQEINTKDEFSSKLINVPNVPVYNEDNDKTALRLKEFSPTSAKLEFGKPGEKALISMKVRNEETINSFGRIDTESKVKFDSPYIRHEAGRIAKDTVMNNVVEPLRDSIGRTAADTTLGTAVLATAFLAAPHLPDGNAKIDIPTKSLTGDKDLKTRLIVSYGEGKSLRASGVEISNKFEYGSQNINVKASYRKDAEVNGVKDVERVQVDAVISDRVIRPDSGTISFRAEHNKVTGASVGLFYQKQF